LDTPSSRTTASPRSTSGRTVVESTRLTVAFLSMPAGM
jgi:hypothetical protein